MKTADFIMLREIYLKRCLSTRQAWLLFYKEKGISYETFYRGRIIPFNNLKIIKLYYTGHDEAIFLTNAGIEIVRYKFDLPTLVLNSKNKITRKTLTEASLTLNPKLINHQLNLNQFVFQFERQHKKRYPEKKFSYYDEKYLSKYNHIRPDGMLSISNTDLFLEMDMGTETKKQLMDKFIRYRRFLDTREFQNSESKIIVLFILKTSKNNLQARKDLVKYAIMQTLTSALPENIDFYIGSNEELMSAVFHKILPIEYGEYVFDKNLKNTMQRHGFATMRGKKLKNFFYDSSFRYYSRKLNDKKKIVIENGVVQEFVMDEYYYSPLSIMSKLTFFEKTRTMFYYKYKRMLNLIVILDNVKNAYHDFNLNSFLSIKGVYFTTYERLKTMPLHKALFVFDYQGNIRHFSDNSYKGQVHECNIEEI